MSRLSSRPTTLKNNFQLSCGGTTVKKKSSCPVGGQLSKVSANLPGIASLARLPGIALPSPRQGIPRKKIEGLPPSMSRIEGNSTRNSTRAIPKKWDMPVSSSELHAGNQKMVGACLAQVPLVLSTYIPARHSLSSTVEGPLQGLSSHRFCSCRTGCEAAFLCSVSVRAQALWSAHRQVHHCSSEVHWPPSEVHRLGGRNYRLRGISSFSSDELHRPRVIFRRGSAEIIAGVLSFRGGLQEVQIALLLGFQAVIGSAA